jgi:hypothetical protein
VSAAIVPSGTWPSLVVESLVARFNQFERI